MRRPLCAARQAAALSIGGQGGAGRRPQQRHTGARSHVTLSPLKASKWRCRTCHLRHYRTCQLDAIERATCGIIERATCGIIERATCGTIFYIYKDFYRDFCKDFGQRGRTATAALTDAGRCAGAARPHPLRLAHGLGASPLRAASRSRDRQDAGFLRQTPRRPWVQAARAAGGTQTASGRPTASAKRCAANGSTATPPNTEHRTRRTSQNARCASPTAPGSGKPRRPIEHTFAMRPLRLDVSDGTRRAQAAPTG